VRGRAVRTDDEGGSDFCGDEDPDRPVPFLSTWRRSSPPPCGSLGLAWQGWRGRAVPSGLHGSVQRPLRPRGPCGCSRRIGEPGCTSGVGGNKWACERVKSSADTGELKLAPSKIAATVTRGAGYVDGAVLGLRPVESPVVASATRVLSRNVAAPRGWFWRDRFPTPLGGDPQPRTPLGEYAPLRYVGPRSEPLSVTLVCSASARADAFLPPNRNLSKSFLVYSVRVRCRVRRAHHRGLCRRMQACRIRAP